MVTLLLHCFVCARLVIFKRKSVAVSPETACSSRMTFLREIDGDVIVTFVDNFAYFVVFAVALRFNDFLEQIHVAQDSTTVSLSMIIAPPSMQLASFVVIYIKNKKLRTFFLRAVLELVAKTREMFGQSFYDVN